MIISVTPVWGNKVIYGDNGVYFSPVRRIMSLLLFLCFTEIPPLFIQECHTPSFIVPASSQIHLKKSIIWTAKLN